MAKPTLRTETPVGMFTRSTDSAYGFVTVWASPRALACFQRSNNGEKITSAVGQRWVKDRGYGVTWHRARPTPPKHYGWDAAATLVGVFPVSQ